MREFENGCPECGGTLWHLEGCSMDKSGIQVCDAPEIECDECGRILADSDEIYTQEIDGKRYHYCRDCLNKMTLDELLELFNIDLWSVLHTKKQERMRI